MVNVVDYMTVYYRSIVVGPNRNMHSDFSATLSPDGIPFGATTFV